MNLRNLSLALFPLLALFIGWGIQPVGYTKVAVPGSKEVWPEFAKAQFRNQVERKSLVLDTSAPQFVTVDNSRH